MTPQETIAITALFTGGLGGAVLKQVFDTYTRRRQKKVAHLDLSQTQYRLPLSVLHSPAGGAHEMKVTFNGKPYEHLYACAATLTAKSTIPPFQLHFLYTDEDEILSLYSRRTPLPASVPASCHEEDGVHFAKFEIPALEAGDSLALGFLANGRSSGTQVVIRGAAEVSFILNNSEERITPQSAALLRQIVIAMVFGIAALAFNTALAAHTLSPESFRQILWITIPVFAVFVAIFGRQALNTFRIKRKAEGMLLFLGRSW